MPPRAAVVRSTVSRQPQPSTSSNTAAGTTRQPNIYTSTGGEDPIQTEEREFAVYALESFDIQTQLSLQNNQTLAGTRLRYLKKLAGLPEDKLPSLPAWNGEFNPDEYESNAFDIDSDEDDDGEPGPSTAKSWDKQKRTK